jgi:hypothetical protein
MSNWTDSFCCEWWSSAGGPGYSLPELRHFYDARRTTLTCRQSQSSGTACGQFIDEIFGWQCYDRCHSGSLFAW